jgi:hypothetical protein
LLFAVYGLVLKLDPTHFSCGPHGWRINGPRQRSGNVGSLQHSVGNKGEYQNLSVHPGDGLECSLELPMGTDLRSVITCVISGDIAAADALKLANNKPARSKQQP